MGTAGCLFLLAVEAQEVMRFLGPGFSKKGKLDDSEDVNAGGMSPVLRDRNSLAVVEVESHGSCA